MDSPILQDRGIRHSLQKQVCLNATRNNSYDNPCWFSLSRFGVCIRLEPLTWVVMIIINTIILLILTIIMIKFFSNYCHDKAQWYSSSSSIPHFCVCEITIYPCPCQNLNRVQDISYHFQTHWHCMHNNCWCVPVCEFGTLKTVNLSH